METAKLKKFAQFARRSLIEQVSGKLKLVLLDDSAARRESAEAIKKLDEAIRRHGKEQVIERVAYIWFNRFCALRFMDVNRYTRIGVVSPAEGQFQPEILAEAKMGHIDQEMVNEKTRQQIFALLDGKAPSRDPQSEAYRLLVVGACNHWHRAMPFLFERIDDYTELLMPDDLLSGNSILAQVREAIALAPVASGQWPVASKSEAGHQPLTTNHSSTSLEVEVIGWLYQFYISEKKDNIFEGLKKNKKITPENIPAATQLFTPHWIVRYLVENSLGRLWMLNRPASKLVERMDYYIPPVDSGQLSVASKEGAKHGEKLQGADCLAEGYGFGGGSVSAEQNIPERGTLRSDQSDQASGSVDSLEHSGRASSSVESGVSKLSLDRTGLAGGSGNPTLASHTPQLSVGVRHSESTSAPGRNQQNAGISPDQTGHWPLTTDYLRISSPEEIRICDPACGSGHMLTYAFDLLYAIYEEEGYEPAEIPEKILTHNLYGIEIDERAGELAAFALTMKARARQRRFFRKPVQPNICVLENVQFDEGELKEYMDFVGRDLFTAPLQTTLRQFEEADNFGSLIRPDVTDVAGMLKILESKNVSGHLFLSLTHQKVLQALRQADYLSPKYHVAIANPPYKKKPDLNDNLQAWLENEFPDGKYDLYQAFILRNAKLAVGNGYVAMITMQGWMFAPRYEVIRCNILTHYSILSMAQLGERAFDSIGGEVVSTTAFVLVNKHDLNLKGQFIRLTEEKNEQEKNLGLLSAAKSPNSEIRFLASDNDFLKIPGQPLVFWASEQVRSAFQNYPAISEYIVTREGLTTGSNALFLREWHEVSQRKVGYGIANEASAKESRKRWFPYVKGGGSRRWYGNFEHFVNWFDDGVELKNFKDEKTGRIRSHNYNGIYGFRPGFTWSGISSNDFAVRDVPSCFMFDAKGPMGFVSGSIPVEVVEAFLNSRVSSYFLRMLAPTLDFKLTHVLSLPLSQVDDPDLLERVNQNVYLAKADWDSYETSWDFTKLPLLHPDYRQPTLKSIYQKLRTRWQEMTLEMQRLEEENNRIFIEAYGLQDELTPEVPLREITLTCNPHYRYGVEECEVGSEKWEEMEAKLLQDTMKELISYAVGCMFGRYSLDIPGLVLANQGEGIADYIRKVASDQWPVASKEGVNNDSKKLQGSDRLAEGNGLGRAGLSGNQGISERRVLRADQSGTSGSSVGSIEHCRGASEAVGCRVQKLSVDSKGLSGRSGNATADSNSAQLSISRTVGANHVGTSGSQQNAIGIDGKTGHWPLATSHLLFVPDEDNVIPMLDGDWFADDIAERFRKFLRVTFGEEHYEANLKFIEKALGKNGKSRDIRDYFLKDFYNDHVKRYKKRPIYWLFSSPKGSFNALIYMHRYRPDTVSVVLNDYLREFRTKLISHKHHLEAVSISGSSTQGEKTKALKEIEKVSKMIVEMEEYEREVLYPLATEQVEIDLDDGVKVNYAKFGAALKKIVGLDAKEET